MCHAPNNDKPIIPHPLYVFSTLGHTPINIVGECFLVERYESDEEEEDGSLQEGRRGTVGVSSFKANNGSSSKKGHYSRSLGGFSSSFLLGPDRNKEVMVVLTERFLEEKSTQGDVCSSCLY